MGFCLVFIETAWGCELFLKKSLVVRFSNFGSIQGIIEDIQKKLNRAMPSVLFFLLKSDFTEKTVYFFSTCSRDAGIAIDGIKKACPNAICGLSLKVELKTPLNDESAVIIPNDIIENGLRR